ncbi:MAG: phenylalanine--tRNA ligase subunit beta [Alphaproteobacteria bacterium]|nr:phenylalanine--tRNA ligase subunit beta [Alphaproteobacteria bacterium]
MKFTYSWLQKHLDTSVSISDLSNRLTQIGLEVESVKNLGDQLSSFVIAEIKETEPHPQADRLKICTVDYGQTIKVVCGAPNARAGIKVVFASVGTYVPGLDITLKKAVIRGTPSEGMLCSARELGLGQEDDGIMELPMDAPVGYKIVDYLNLNDPVFDVAVTPNRADALSVYGIARDLAVADVGKLKPLSIKPVKSFDHSPISWKHEKGMAGKACPVVVGRYFKNVKNGKSPKWLAQALESVGHKSISALVDITNYLTLDLGRPLHVFDADKLTGSLTMRMAKTGEKLAALDNKIYDLDSSMLVIADDKGVQSIAGIMGGLHSGCQENTTNIFLEVALFDPISIAKTGRHLGIHSEARFRFERGIDPQSILWGIDAASQLILDICGGEASDVVVSGTIPPLPQSINMCCDRVQKLLGVEIKNDYITFLLEKLGCVVSQKDKGDFVVTPPSWRLDLIEEIDLVEEIARFYGYDNIPATPLPVDSTQKPSSLQHKQTHLHTVKRTLAGRGLAEAITYSFMAQNVAEKFTHKGATSLPLLNPISADLAVMRPSIIPNLLKAALKNQDYGHKNLGLFEIGPVFYDNTATGQKTIATLLRAGKKHNKNWLDAERPIDVYDIKADVKTLLKLYRLDLEQLQLSTKTLPSWYHPYQSAELLMGNKSLGYFGALHPALARDFDCADTPIVLAEIFVDNIPYNYKDKKTPLVQSPYQAVERDFAFVVDHMIEAGQIVQAINTVDKKLIKNIDIFDVYSGPHLPEGKKSLAFSVTIQSDQKTLVDQEIQDVCKKIIAKVQEKTGAVLR